MLLRIVSTQPPIEVTRIVSAGRTACRSTSPMNGNDHDAESPVLLPKPTGSQLSSTENTSTDIIAIQKYGNADVTTNSGGSTLSIAPPRRQALTAPIAVPATNARIVVTPTRPSVHGSAVSTT